MKAARLLPYLFALVLLSWILGSLARSGTAGGNILANSTWLVYTVELLPLVALGLMVIMAGWLVWNWRFLSDAIARRMSRRRVQKKKWTKLETLMFMAVWGVASVILLFKCHGLNCGSAETNSTATVITSIVSAGGPIPPLPFAGPVLAFARLIDTNWFSWAFFALLIVSSIIVVRAIIMHLQDTHNQLVQLFEVAQEQGREAVRVAIGVLDDASEGDPRRRIMISYQKMVAAASNLGAPVGPDKTARELERGIRNMFLLKGPGIAGLTGLFEEARYSLHPMTWEDAEVARDCFIQIRDELDRTVSIEA